MAVVRFEAISQKFGDFFALNDVNASFESAKIHAVLGENGAGKSTLMKVLFGLQKPTT
ncbi:MAG: ATP-binding cassette domain-containing protein, partial [Bdellovibrionaceae bacterium]|nr:ATP-binding cassette domain-containing protein [Pseudobdellovibrionaceae bacterium]